MDLPRELRTNRLLLRRWRPEDRPAFVELNADPRVAEFLGEMTPEQRDAMAGRIEAHFGRHGYGMWAVELPGVTPFAGFIGSGVPRIEAHFTPCVEVGWRLHPDHWGKGYATEGARAAVAFGFEFIGLPEVVAYTAVGNVRSRRVMGKLGMTCSPADDFDHPLLPAGHPLRRHVLYRLRRT